jgi:hypothetical protein
MDFWQKTFTGLNNMEGTMMNPFDFVNAINKTKKNLIAEDPETERSYSPWLTNLALSQFPESIYPANDMNRLNHLPSRTQFQYLLNTVRRGSRYGKWAKMDEETKNRLSLISRVYGCRNSVARKYLSILSEEQIKQLEIDYGQNME